MSASVAIDDSIRRLRSSGRSIREIKRLPRHESPKLSRLPKVYPCAVVAGHETDAGGAGDGGALDPRRTQTVQ